MFLFSLFVSFFSLFLSFFFFDIEIPFFFLFRAAVDSVFPSYQFDVVEDLVVDWHWVLAFKDTVYRINERAKKVLHDRGVRFSFFFFLSFSFLFLFLFCFFFFFVCLNLLFSFPLTHSPTGKVRGSKRQRWRC